jgi:uncharacterized SAM-binding protein YcdF (DUF218 family)
MTNTPANSSATGHGDSLLLRWFWQPVRTILMVIGSLWLIVSLTPLDRWWATALAGEWNDDVTGDTLIVLAADGGSDGVIGYGTYLRCQYAILAWRQGGFRNLLASGGAQAYAMRDFLIGEGIPASAIQTETQSLSTRENALFTANALAKVSGPKVMLTSDYHMFRASRAFRRAGLAVVPSPCPDVLKRASRWNGRWSAFLDLMIESAKIVYYKARGWI